MFINMEMNMNVDRPIEILKDSLIQIYVYIYTHVDNIDIILYEEDYLDLKDINSKIRS